MSRAEFNDGRGVFRLWGGWLLAILGWVLHLGLSYGLVGWYCERGQGTAPHTVRIMLHGITIVAALMAATGLVLAWRNLQSVRRSPDARDRSRFMAIAGVLSSTLFLCIILAQGVPIMILELCQ